MSRRQTKSERWFLVTDAAQACDVARGLPPGTGVLLLTKLTVREMRRLRQVAHARRLVVEEERRGNAARVHNMRELRSALGARTPLILLSPTFPTRTHPEWAPLPRMRAATLARLAGRSLVALGGMDERRYAKIGQLGFSGWAGVSAFRT